MDHEMKTHTALKTQAKRLRAALAESGITLTHSASLELIAKTHGHRDWNTACALADHAATQAARQDPSQTRQQSGDQSGPKWQVGGALRGTYLGHPFTGILVSLARKGDSHFDIALQSDAPINVSKSALFDAPRRRIRATIDLHGCSVGATSDGEPHLRLA